MRLDPDFSTDPAAARRCWARHGYAPLVTDGARLTAVRETLHARAMALGYVLTDDPALRLVADGRVLLPARHGDIACFALPPNARHIALASRAGAPADVDPGATDRRRLGVAVAALEVDGAVLPAGDARHGPGWLAAEPAWQWTDGHAAIICPGAREIRVRCAATGLRYWTGSPEPARHAGRRKS
jgi:hypothetical protein